MKILGLCFGWLTWGILRGRARPKLEFCYVMLAESSLSFLGYGVPPPAPTWGQMLGLDAQRFFFVAPWLAIAPGVALTIVVFAINIFGDALRDRLDPRQRGT